MNETYRPEILLRPQLVKKVSILFFTLQNATFFVKTCFHENSRYARQKMPDKFGLF